jgi:amino-acid N-acetyltransferase
MMVRSAKISDATRISELISEYAEQDRMLFRSMADIYKNLQGFSVAELDGKVVGCCALEVIWSDLAEIKSLAVDKGTLGRKVGTVLVSAATEQANRLGIQKVFALTLDPQFFEKLGFQRLDKDLLPMKVWSDCARCSKQDHCDEVAVVRVLGSEP